jgi:chromosome segregation ATPase
VWGHDHRGREVTCERLDTAHDLWLAVYGGTGPLTRLDVGAQVRHLAELRDVLTPLLTALAPAREDLEQLEQRLLGEVTDALTRAEHAGAQAEHARRDTHTAQQARTLALAATEAAEAERDAARHAENQALTERDQARTDKTEAARREHDAHTRATAAAAMATEATTALRAAHATIAQDAARLGELSGANNHLTARVDELATETANLRGLLEEHRTQFQTALHEQRTESDRQRQHTERAATSQVTELTTQLAHATARAEQAAAEHTQTLAHKLTRLRTRLLATLATASPRDDVAALRAHLTELLAAEDEPQR